MTAEREREQRTARYNQDTKSQISQWRARSWMGRKSVAAEPSKADCDATTSFVLECYENSFMLWVDIGRPTLPKKRHFIVSAGIGPPPAKYPALR